MINITVYLHVFDIIKTLIHLLIINLCRYHSVSTDDYLPHLLPSTKVGNHAQRESR